MVDWHTAPLEHFLTRATYGFTNPMPTTDIGPFMVTARDINGGRILFETARKTSEAAYKQDITDKSRPDIGDVLVTKDGTLGRMAVVDRPNVCINQSVALLKPANIIRSRFLKYLLEEPTNFARMLGDADGTTIKHIYITRLAKMEVSVPELAYQDQILDVLASLDDKIELNRRMNETLEEMARALFRDWFIDFGPTRRQMDGATDPAAIMGHAFPNNKAATLAPLFPARLGENGLPEGWNWGAVSDIADLNPKIWTVKKHPEKVDYLDLGNTKRGRIEETTGYLWSEAPSRAKRILEPGDTIVGTVRPGNGSYALIGREGLTGSTGFAVLRPKHRSVTEFVYLALTSPENIDILANLADGGAYPAINPKVVADTKIVLADSKVVEGFSNLTQSIFDKRHFNEQESQTLAQIRDLLLPKLMSGEIQLKDAPMVQDTLDGAAQILIMPAEIEKENRRKFEANIGWRDTGEDQIKPKIQEVIKQVEDIYCPYLMDKKEK